MVKYGRHLEFLRQRFPKSVYLVDYKGIQHSTDRAAFSADWQEGLARATAAKEEGVAGLWSRVFQGVSSDPELRGVRPLVALHTYHGAVGAAETQQLLDDYSEVRQAAVANWEALRKLVKKFDKNAPEAEALSGELLPKLYASSLTSLVHADDVFPFETLKALAHPVNSDGEEAEEEPEEEAPPAAASIVHSIARRASMVPGAGAVTSILSAWAPSVLTSMQDSAVAPAIRSRLQKWRQAGASRAASQREMEEMQVGRRADELAWLRSVVANDIDKDIMRRLVAHRGFHSINDRTDRRPIENSLEAYELAWTSGVVLCECDVAVTRDGKLVLGHDADYSRLALRVPGEEAKRGLHVGELTLAQLIAMPLKSGSRPPTLLEVLRSASMVGNGSQLVIEIKPGNVTAADALIHLLRGHPELLPCVGVVMSFDAFIMNDFAAMLSALVATPWAGAGGMPRSISVSAGMPRVVSVPGFNPGGHMPRVTSAAAQLSHYMVARDSVGGPQEGRMGRLSSVALPEGSVAKGPTVPKLLLLTVAEKPEKPFEMWLDIMKDTAGVEEAAKHLDGVYIEFQQEMLTPEGRAALSQLAARRTVGVWMRAERDPDNLATATELMNSCGVSFVNTDLPQTFTAAARAAYAEVSVASPTLRSTSGKPLPGKTGARSFKTKSSDEDSAISSPEKEAEALRQEAEAKRGPRPPSATAEMSRQRDMSLSDVLSSGANDEPPGTLG